jgi:hypothetical protein
MCSIPLLILSSWVSGFLTEGIPDYFTVIKNPMDFGTIKKKLNLNIYQSVEGFLNDMSQVFINCRLYNGTESPVGRIGVNIRREYDRLLGMYNFVERFQNSQQVHPSVLFIKEIQGKKKEEKQEEAPQKENVEPQKPEGSELEIEKKLPLIPEVNANQIVEESQQITPQVNQEGQKESNKIEEEVPSEPVPVQTQENENQPKSIQIEESSLPVVTEGQMSEEKKEQNIVPIEAEQNVVEKPDTPEVVKSEKEEMKGSLENKPINENQSPIDEAPKLKDEMNEKISSNLNTETNIQKAPELENKIKEASEDSLLNDSLKEAKSPEKAETKAPENPESKPV